MRIPLFKRLVITALNILFPPLAVMLITGPNEDFLFNCVMFILAIIPSHIHGFYISLTYFNRKRKVRRGIYPGKPRHLIWSDRVNNGGASRREVERLRYERDQGKLSRRASRRVTGSSGSGGSRRRIEDWDDGYKEYARSNVLDCYLSLYLADGDLGGALPNRSSWVTDERHGCAFLIELESVEGVNALYPLAALADIQGPLHWDDEQDHSLNRALRGRTDVPIV
ncbi:hypothetical protein AYO21_04013 [Fonsecaea monophora]|uniref:Plasma membrane proteolipid 3 n=1 Tax=Fonsecaea monophora TaxID=254056 RepID=A0A177FCA8_9EURO|nr:hypothetical protein AYO21_04013 [Fonsecaea monophora]KAH0847807.1 hypothetical protein FOPE_01039 [Fonsecaea pedrosoi]OAG41778.1 hypothetical protein AYO21_04013 [Fonsecaea monophora]